MIYSIRSFYFHKRMEHDMKKRNKVFIIIVVLIMIIITAFSIMMKNIDKNMRALLNEEIAEIDLSNTSDGVYTGEHIVLPISVKVKVTVKEGRITGIDLIRHLNGQGKEAESIINAIVNQQSVKVDTISGATYSSIVIIKAIEAAIDN